MPTIAWTSSKNVLHGRLLKPGEIWPTPRPHSLTDSPKNCKRWYRCRYLYISVSDFIQITSRGCPCTRDFSHPCLLGCFVVFWGERVLQSTPLLINPRPPLRTGLACSHWSSVNDTLQMLLRICILLLLLLLLSSSSLLWDIAMATEIAKTGI